MKKVLQSMTQKAAKKDPAEETGKEKNGNRVERRSGIEPRVYDYFTVIPERRKGNDRRKSDK